MDAKVSTTINGSTVGQQSLWIQLLEVSGFEPLARFIETRIRLVFCLQLCLLFVGEGHEKRSDCWTIGNQVTVVITRFTP